MSRFRDLNDLRARCGDRAADQVAAQFAAAPAGEVAPVEIVAEAPPARRKLRNNVSVDDQGRRWDSDLERDTFADLEKRCLAVIRQVSIPLDDRPGGTRIRLDFLEVHEVLPDGRFIGRFSDPKGFVTPTAKAKLNWFESKYRVPVRIIKRGDLR